MDRKFWKYMIEFYIRQSAGICGTFRQHVILAVKNVSKNVNLAKSHIAILQPPIETDTENSFVNNRLLVCIWFFNFIWISLNIFVDCPFDCYFGHLTIYLLFWPCFVHALFLFVMDLISSSENSAKILLEFTLEVILSNDYKCDMRSITSETS